MIRDDCDDTKTPDVTNVTMNDGCDDDIDMKKEVPTSFELLKNKKKQK